MEIKTPSIAIQPACAANFQLTLPTQARRSRVGARSLRWCIAAPLVGVVLAVQAAPPNSPSGPVDESRANWARVEDARPIAHQLDAIHAVSTDVVQERQLNPLRAARLFAAVRLAQFEAVRALPQSDADLVARVAATKVLTWLLPQHDPERWLVPAVSMVRARGGLSAATEAQLDVALLPVLSHLLDDGSDARRRALEKPPPGPGTWMRTPPLFAEQPLEPQGAGWRPWCSGSDLVDVPPSVKPGTPQWREEVRQVAEVSARLTVDEKAIATRWHLDAGSITPPGVWNAIVVAYQSTLGPEVASLRRQQVLAVVNMAMQDALVASWRIKLRDWSERPMTAVRREMAPDFEPYLVTPPFPGYVSGHATVSAAAATVLAHFYPDRSELWHALAREAAMSRLYGGIHFASDNEQGLALGRQVAQRCIAALQLDDKGREAVRFSPGPDKSPGFFVLPRIAAPRD